MRGLCHDPWMLPGGPLPRHTNREQAVERDHRGAGVAEDVREQSSVSLLGRRLSTPLLSLPLG